MNSARIVVAAAALVGVLPTTKVGTAYEVLTHRMLTDRAVEASRADARLRDELTVDAGLSFVAQGRSVLAAAIDGAAHEDELCCTRYLHHFHNPLRTDWFEAGLKANAPAPPLRIGASAIEWGQAADEPLQPWSWSGARLSFLDALRGGTAPERDAALAGTFEALGHLVHLVQDAASPAHTRNDVHVHYNYETFVAAVQQREGLDLGAIVPGPAWWSLPGSERAPVPIARLIDSDRYGAGVPTVTVDGQFIGLAEYASANFFSEDTVFGRADRVYESFPFPARSSVERHVLPLGADPAAPGREYYWKTADGDTGYRLATVSFLRYYDTLYNVDEARLSDKPALDDHVYRDYMARLLPRAVGYSTALVDYFFRGRLEVGLLDDAGEPRLVGVNASEEPLRDGRLYVYAEDGSGVRRLASDAGGHAVPGPIAPGAALPEVPVSITGDVRRLVAVYMGGLGAESPTTTAPGAVIGKVFPPLEVEEIYRGGDSWMIRTPRVVAALPLRVEDYSDVRWGDDQSFILATTTDGRGFAVYEVGRAPVSGRLLAEGEPPTALLTLWTTASLPLTAPAPLTRVSWSHTLRHRQQIGRFGYRTVAIWNPPSETTPGYYTDGGSEHIPVEFETAQERSLTFAGNFPVVLDEIHRATSGAATTPYVWVLQEVAVDSQRRLLGLVVVYLTDPGVPATEIPLMTVSPSGDLVPAAADRRALRPGFPLETSVLLWALVNLQSGEVVSSTADETVTIAWQQSIDEPIRLFRHYVSEVIGGGPAEPVDEWYPATPTPRMTHTADTQADTRSGDDALTVTGWMRGALQPTLATAGLLDTSVTRSEAVAYFNYACIVAVCTLADADAASYAIVHSAGAIAVPPVQFVSAARGQAPPGGERLLLLGDVSRGDDWPRGTLVVWEQEADRAAVRLDLPAAFSRDVAPATASLALVYNRRDPFERETATSYVVGLDDGETLAFPGTDLRQRFRLLAPGYLYDVEDMKFYRRQAPLQPTALPAALKPVDGNPIGSYHVVTPR